MKTKLTLHALLFSTILFAACNNNSNANHEPAPVDSIKLKDSLAKAEIKRADENKVIGDIEFGITEDVFNKETELFQKSLKTNAGTNSYQLGNYEFRRIEGSFEDLKLYEATLIGYLQHYEEYESNLIPQVETLKTMLVGRYGEPSKGNGAPAWHQTKNDYNYLAYQWNVGSKSVEIRVSDRGLYYTADLKIFKPDVEEAIAQRAANKDKETADKAKDVL